MQGPWGELSEMRAERHADMSIYLEGYDSFYNPSATDISAVSASLLTFVLSQ